MSSHRLSIEPYLQALHSTESVLLDSRSESEYAKGHIPGAENLPLLKDEHRQIIGTLYKQEGREAAVLKGFELAGPLFHTILLKAIKLIKGKEVFLYCWRGGMRSNITAWLLQTAGINVTILEGGYKTYRNLIINEFNRPRKVIVLGGKTGSGKTEVLNLIGDDQHQIIDLEQLANHKGSAYGALGLPPQPSQEHFENLLGYALLNTNPDKILWLENESRHIGNVNLPNAVYELIRNAVVVEIEIPEKLRRERILMEYGCFSKDLLMERTVRFGKRLGNDHVKKALEALAENDLDTWLEIVLHYYDKAYAYGNEQRPASSIVKIETDLKDAATLSEKLKEAAEEKLQLKSNL